MLLDLIDLSKLRRSIAYGLMLVALFVLQDMVLVRIPVLGVRPMLVPSAVVAVGLFEGGLWGGMVGLVAGIFSDIAYANSVALFTVLLPTAGFFTGVLGKYMLHKGLVSFIALSLLTLAVIALCQMFPFLFFLDEDVRAFRAALLGSGGDWPVWRTGLIQVLYSLILGMIVYVPCKLIASRPMGR